MQFFKNVVSNGCKNNSKNRVSEGSFRFTYLDANRSHFKSRFQVRLFKGKSFEILVSLIDSLLNFISSVGRVFVFFLF